MLCCRRVPRRDARRKEDAEGTQDDVRLRSHRVTPLNSKRNRHTEEKPKMKAHAYTKEFLQQVWPQSGCSWSFRGPARGREPSATENRTSSNGKRNAQRSAQRSAHKAGNFGKESSNRRTPKLRTAYSGIGNSGMCCLPTRVGLHTLF